MLLKVLLCLAGGGLAYAQSSGQELGRAQANMEELRKQVDAGVAPRAKLQEAEAALADARDADLLDHLLRGQDLTEEQTAQMQEAAQRRLERRKADLERVQSLLQAGVVPARDLAGPTGDLKWAQTEYDLTRSRAGLIRELAEMARAEQQALEAPQESESLNSPAMERFDGNGSFTADDFKQVKAAFEKQFTKPLPVSADGETAVHRALGYDHRSRVDVAIFPDTAEGLWLRHYLESSEIPYYAFRSFIPGKATAAHIHIGPPSGRVPTGRPRS